MGLPDLPEQNDDEVNFTMGEDHIINVEVTTDDSENESVEENEYMGYQPLSLNDNNEAMSEIQIDDMDVSSPGSPLNGPSEPPNQELLNLDVWNAPRPDVLNIELDTAKAAQIVNVMAGFKLPVTSVPEWAVGVPEERWKEDLLERIRQRQHPCTKSV